jgi:hypothetical protein
MHTPAARRTARRLTSGGPAFLAAMFSLAVTAVPAEGQLLKRIKQAAQEKVADAVGQTETGGSASAPAAPAEKKGPTPITAERLEVFLVSMRPAIDAAERGRAEFEARKAHGEATKRYESAAKRYEACTDTIMVRERPRLVALATRDPNFQTRLQYRPEWEPLFEAQRQAMARNDVPRMEAIGDSLAVLQRAEFARLIPALKECGQAPRKPAAAPTASETTPEQLIVPPAGMTRSQFGRLRERVAVYAITGGKEDPFTAEERAVLDARAADLAKLAPLFRDGLLEWGQWGQDSGLAKRWSSQTAGAEPGGR